MALNIRETNRQGHMYQGTVRSNVAEKRRKKAKAAKAARKTMRRHAK